MNQLLSYDEWMSDLEEKVDKIPRVQAVISSFEVLPRLGKLLSDKSNSCSECFMYWQKLQESTLHFDQFFEDGNRYSIDFENLVEIIMQHLKISHAIRPKGYLLSLYTLAGMVVGVLLGAIVGFAFLSGEYKGAVLLGWLIGMLLGWSAGTRKEKRMRKQSRIF
ncbi:hypothetical protein SAMN06265379_10138 [Saccharicrinis carchari]|uniref:Glycine zipper family protein n=1 Tax=Saccharicrinis carchari TaxID=1168039 RepID=A0A521ACT8_SACCC|nr:hypothetical protein [Saccharicrinis carchari]SMO32615.1 hypothetical protein SAMN06265379_10138 [Saccharicrinis carchari]